MGKAHGLALALALVIVGGACSAQQRPALAVQGNIPFQQIQHTAQLQTIALLDAAHATGADAVGNDSSSAALAASALAPNATPGPEPATTSWTSTYRPVSPVATTRTLSPSYFLLNGLHLGMAVFDVEMTQHCIADHHCKEGNPLMPSSQVGQLSVSFGTFGYAAVTSYWLRKRHSRLWWIAPSTGIAAHSVGVASGFENR
jgi:hypothetical protein